MFFSGSPSITSRSACAPADVDDARSFVSGGLLRDLLDQPVGDAQVHARVGAVEDAGF